MGSVTGDVGVVVPVNDVVEPLPPDGLTAVAALVIAPGVFVDVIAELPDPDEDVLLLGVDMLELIDGERDGVGAVCVNSSEIPLLPSTDPVWTLTIGLQGREVVLVSAGVWLGGVSEVGFGETCATAVDAHAMLMQMNRGSFISNLLYRFAVRFREIFVQAASHTAAPASEKSRGVFAGVLAPLCRRCRSHHPLLDEVGTRSYHRLWYPLVPPKQEATSRRTPSSKPISF